MMRSSAYNRLGVLMGTSARASGPRWLSWRRDSLPMIPLISSQGDFCATANRLRLQLSLFGTELFASISHRRTTLSVTESARHGLLSHMTVDLGLGAAHRSPNHPIETQKLSHPPCVMRVDLPETVGQQASAG